MKVLIVIREKDFNFIFVIIYVDLLDGEKYVFENLELFGIIVKVIFFLKCWIVGNFFICELNYL